MFANEDSLRMPRDVRTALSLLCRQVVDAGFAAGIPDLDIVEGRRPRRKAANHPLQSLSGNE
jgi:hypothetical protein